jgi:hypothetical protein
VKSKVDIDRLGLDDEDKPMGGGRSLRRNYGLSTVIGAYAGVILQLIATSWQSGGVSYDELWALPIIILGYGLFAIPAVALGLMVFGIPALRLLRQNSDRWWIGCIAIASGALAGKLVFLAVDHTFFMGFYEFARISFVDMGVLYGVPTGLAWWVLNRPTPNLR